CSSVQARLLGCPGLFQVRTRNPFLLVSTDAEGTANELGRVTCPYASGPIANESNVMTDAFARSNRPGEMELSVRAATRATFSILFMSTPGGWIPSVESALAVYRGRGLRTGAMLVQIAGFDLFPMAPWPVTPRTDDRWCNGSEGD